MAKRFTDTVLWDKPWYTTLTPAEKCAWGFIKDKCDQVGVWEPNFFIADTYIGEKIDWQSFREKCNGNIIVLKNGKWWLVDFCSFQYGELSETSKAPPVKSYIRLLKKHGLWELYQKGIDTLSIPYAKGSDTPKDKDKEKDKEKDNSAAIVKTNKQTKNTILFNKIKDSFTSISGDFTSYPKEGSSIKRIIEYAKNDEKFIQSMLETFLKLTRGTDKFWSGQPFTPSTLAASGIWDRVKIEAEKQKKANEPWWDRFEAEEEARRVQ